MMRTFSLLLLALLALLPAAADWPQWRGPDRSGISRETGLLKTWPAAGPRLVWEFDKTGQGYSAPAVVGGVVYAMGARGNDEYVIAIAEGKQKWATKIGPVHDFKSNRWSRGPNSTPCVDGDRVFALGSQGILVCVKKTDGTEVWRKDCPRQLDADIVPESGGPEKIGWGFCWSPIVDGDQLVCTPGGAKGLFAALDKTTGKVRWRSKGVPDRATYSSPIMATLAGVKQYVYPVKDGLVSVAAKDGALLWRHKRDNEYPDVVSVTPLVQGNLVTISVGYGGGSCEQFKVGRSGANFKAQPVWQMNVIGNKQGGVVLVGGHLYGYHDDRNWACVDFARGTLVWPKKRGRQNVKAGSVCAADGRLYVLDEEGTVAMLDAAPAGYKELSKFKLPKESKKRKEGGKVWAHPVLSDGKLYVRDQEYLFCYQVK
jgi:outer membrane protein assembly factor BamB